MPSTIINYVYGRRDGGGYMLVGARFYYSNSGSGTSSSSWQVGSVGQAITVIAGWNGGLAWNTGGLVGQGYYNNGGGWLRYIEHDLQHGALTGARVEQLQDAVAAIQTEADTDEIFIQEKTNQFMDGHPLHRQIAAGADGATVRGEYGPTWDDYDWEVDGSALPSE